MQESTDEELYKALVLEQCLSAEDPSRYVGDSERPSFRCTVSRIVLEKPDARWEYIKLKGKGFIYDPLHPMSIIMLVLWIPINICYLGFQGLKVLISARFVLAPLHLDTVKLLPHQIDFTPTGYALSYQGISSLGYYANGVRVDHADAKLVINSLAAPSLFVALTHLAPTAKVLSGISIPADLRARCSAGSSGLDVSKMHRNPPSSWKVASTDFRLPIPWQKIAAYSIIALLAFTFIPLLF